MNDFNEVGGDSRQNGPQAADELLPLVYEELRKLAAAKMVQEQPGQTLQPTALVHEAWLRLAGSGNQHWQNRGHFFAAAAEAMRRILVDTARRKQRQRHGGGQQRVDLTEADLAASSEDERVIEVNDAVAALENEYPLQAQVVKLRFFAGLKNDEAARALNVSEKTVQRHWGFARAWLFDWLQQHRQIEG